eukprot:Pgem_evm1s14868
MVGQALGGIIVSLTSIGTTALGNSVDSSALIYFISSVCVILISLIAFFFLLRLPFVQYRFHRHHNLKHNAKPQFEVLRTVKAIWPQMINIFLNFFITLTLFPGIIQHINPPTTNGTIQLYYTPVVCFLGFNLFDFLGRNFAGYVQYPRARLLFIPVLLRFIFFVFFLFSHTKYVITDDYTWFPGTWWPVVFIVLFSLSNGYFGSLGMMYAPSLVKPGDEECSGTIMVTCLAFGLLSGS